jgi:hypothetical protein
MNTSTLDDTRTRLSVATADASHALADASQMGRLLINDDLRSPFTAASLTAMKERLHVLGHALGDLEAVHADLRRTAADNDRAARRAPEIPQMPTASRPRRRQLRSSLTAGDASGLTRSRRSPSARAAANRRRRREAGGSREPQRTPRSRGRLTAHCTGRPSAAGECEVVSQTRALAADLQ